MSLSRKKLQKKREKRISKSKARKKQSGGFLSVLGGKVAFNQALQAPVHQCWIPKELFETGIGHLLVSRKTESEQIVFSALLLDVFCLGIKDAFIQLLSQDDYETSLEQISGTQPLKSIHPSCARKLVEDLEDYANNIGFSPHKDYKSAHKIFEDIVSFEYFKIITFNRH